MYLTCFSLSTCVIRDILILNLNLCRTFKHSFPRCRNKHWKKFTPKNYWATQFEFRMSCISGFSTEFSQFVDIYLTPVRQWYVSVGSHSLPPRNMYDDHLYTTIHAARSFFPLNFIFKIFIKISSFNKAREFNFRPNFHRNKGIEDCSFNFLATVTIHSILYLISREYLH